MAWTCRHGRQIYCEWQECPKCCDEEDASRRHDEQMVALDRIAQNTARTSALEDENLRLREEIERLKRSK